MIIQLIVTDLIDYKPNPADHKDINITKAKKGKKKPCLASVLLLKLKTCGTCQELCTPLGISNINIQVLIHFYYFVITIEFLKEKLKCVATIKK